LGLDVAAHARMIARTSRGYKRRPLLRWPRSAYHAPHAWGAMDLTAYEGELDTLAWWETLSAATA